MSAPRVIASDLILAGWLPPNRAADALGISPRQLEQRVIVREPVPTEVKIQTKDPMRQVSDMLSCTMGEVPTIVERLLERARRAEDALSALHAVIRAANPAPGVVKDLDVVVGMIKERQELLNEIAASVPPEVVAQAVGQPQGVPSETTDQFPADQAGEPRAYCGDCVECEGELCPRCEQCHRNGCVAAVSSCDVATTPSALRAALDSLVAVISTGPTAWLRYPDLAWVYGVLVGLNDAELDDLQIGFGWTRDAITVITRHHAAVADARRSE
jgi:hypothetical protein